MRFVVAMLTLLVLSSFIYAQEDVQQVSPALILRECTDAKAECRATAASCTEVPNLVNAVMSWTGIKILFGVAVVILATWFSMFTLAAVYRYIKEMRERTTRSRYVDQLEYTNKLLMETIKKLNEVISKNETEHKMLLESKTILRELLEQKLPEAITEAPSEKPEEARSDDKRSKILRIIRILILIVAISLIALIAYVLKFKMGVI